MVKLIANKIAAIPTPDFGSPKVPGSGITDILGLSASVINILFTVLGGLAVVAIIYGGFQYLTSAGDEDKASSGRKTLTYAITGLILIIVSLVIVNLVQTSIK